MLILRRETKMGYKDARLRLCNYLRKRKTKYGGRCTFREIRRCKGFIVCYFHSQIVLDGISKNIMEA